MYLTNFRLENIKCFADISLDFRVSRNDNDETARQQNWNVILGDNGDGKTTVLQAIASCLMGSHTVHRLVKYDNWPRQGEGYGRLTLELVREAGDHYFDETPNFSPPDDSQYAVQYIVVPPSGFVPDEKRVYLSIGNFSNLPEGSTVKTRPHLDQTEWIDPTEAKDVLTPGDDSLFQKATVKLFQLLNRTHIFSDKKQRGWISCGYGPLRRAYGSTTQGTNINDRLQERFMTLFIEEVALHDCEDWIKNLERLALRRGPHSSDQQKFETVKQTLIDILPDIDDVILDETLQFVREGKHLSLDQLSHGYRTMFVLITDILRWLEMLNANPDIPLNEAAGVVLIDEVDAHLHPKWQRRIGFELTRIFPNIQFIVTTHSPYVAMAAGKGSLTILEKDDEAVVATQHLPHIRDWPVDQVLNDIFQESVYSQVTAQDLADYDTLRERQRAGVLTPQEQEEFHELEADLNERLVNYADSPENQSLQADLEYLKQVIREKRAGYAES